MSSHRIVRRLGWVAIGFLLVSGGLLAAPAAPVSAATLHVTDCGDSGANTLRGRIAAADARDAIVFDQDCTITLTTGTLVIATDDLTINGAARTIIVDGGCAGCGPGGTPSGGVTVFKVNSGIRAEINNLTIQHGNGAPIGNAGGIENDGTLTVAQVTLRVNYTSGYGGAIRNNGTLTVTNSTLSSNTAGSSGGGIRNDGTLTVTNSTLSGNSADNGGGIRNVSGTVNLKNAIVAGNTATNSGPDVRDTVATGGNNLIGTTSGSTGIVGGTNGDIVNPAPLLGPLGNYGGTTQTIPLLPGSPAINAGASGAGVPATDQRSVARDGTPDMGAFESRGFSLAKTSGDNQSRPINTAFAPLVVTVASAFSEPVDGGVVTFTGPGSGADIQTSPVTATITGGQASVTPSANGTTGGPYAVTAAVATGATPPAVSFSLTNTPGAATHLLLVGSPTTQAGQEYRLTVTAKDAANNTVPGYTGTVHIATTDPNARPINDRAFVAADNGVYTFTITLNTEGGRILTATDTATPIITGTLNVAVTGPSVFSPGPALTAVLPRQGPTAGGTAITVTGAGFTSVQSVTVGGVGCTGVQVAAQGTSQRLTCVTGAHGAGTVDVTVTTATGTATAPGAYVYGVPNAAPPSGGTGSPNPAPQPKPGEGQPGAPNPAPVARP